MENSGTKIKQETEILKEQGRNLKRNPERVHKFWKIDESLKGRLRDMKLRMLRSEHCKVFEREM